MTEVPAAPVAAARPRTIRGFYIGLWLLMMAITVAGFWPFLSSFGASATPRPMAIHVHAVVFTGWMILLVTQMTLVYQRRTPMHRSLGRFGMAWGVLVLVMGLVASAVAPVGHVRAGEWTLDQAAEFLIFPLGDMLLWAILFGAAMAFRRRPEVHKRFILLATVALLFAPAARLVNERSIPLLLLLWLAPLFIAMSYDRYSRGRVHAAYVVGLAILLAGFSRLMLMKSPAWLGIGRTLLRAVGAP